MSALLTKRTAQLPWANPWFMAGTEGTGKYLVTHVTDLGRFGHRDLGGGTRLRVEPTEEGLPILAQHLTRAEGWKQPGDGGENRFSKVVSSDQRDEYEAVASLFPAKRTRTRLLVVAGVSFAATAVVIYWLSC